MVFEINDSFFSENGMSFSYGIFDGSGWQKVGDGYGDGYAMGSGDLFGGNDLYHSYYSITGEGYLDGTGCGCGCDCGNGKDYLDNNLNS